MNTPAKPDVHPFIRIWRAINRRVDWPSLITAVSFVAVGITSCQVEWLAP